ncbi:MAG: TIR domain-containing protein [Aquabacterium sp.]
MRTRPSIPFLLDLLRLAMRKQASAVYIVPWMPPTLRIDEQSVPLSSVAFTPEQSTMLVLDMLDDAHRAALDRSREVQFSFVLEEVGRFRVHAFRRHGQPAMTVRPYAIEVPTPRTLALPALACQAAMAERGLLVVAGRSYALRRDVVAALLEHRNRSSQDELALVDDATRFWHERVRCQVRQGLSSGAVEELLQRRVQRVPVGLTTPPPLVIAWGELRDGPQLQRVVRASDRALCIASLDGDDLMTALHRLIRLSAELPGPELRQRLAIAINGLLSVRPVPAAAGGRDLAATEALITSPDLAANLAEGDLPALRELIAPPSGPVTSSGAPMRGSLMTNLSTGADEHLWQLMVQGLVKPDSAARRAVDREGFTRRTAESDTRPELSAATAPVTVDPGFADLFDPAADAADPFDFADATQQDGGNDTTFDGVDWSGESTVAPAGDVRAAAPAARAVLPTSAQFHAWAPPAARPGSTVAVDLWVALPAQADEVFARASLETGEPQATKADELAPWISLQLRIDGVLLGTPTQRLAWQARPDRVRFNVNVPPQTRPGAHAARVRLAVGGLPIGELSFVLNVSPTAQANAPLEDAQAARRMLQSAYAAFAHSDHNEVQDCAQALLLVAPGLDLFLDAPSLRSNERWRERIEREVGRRERLFLFWSSAAAESPWVDFEWRLMLRRRGVGSIDALLLEPPRLAPLPPELADLASAEVRVKGPAGS